MGMKTGAVDDAGKHSSGGCLIDYVFTKALTCNRDTLRAKLIVRVGWSPCEHWRMS